MPFQARRRTLTTAGAAGLAIVLIAFSTFRAYGDDAGVEVDRRPSPGAYAPDHIVVKFARGVGEIGAALPAQLRPALQATWDKWKVGRTRRAFPRKFANPVAAAGHGLDRTYLLEVPSGTDVRAMADDLAALADHIEFAEVDPIGGVGQLIPNDEFFDRQWGMEMIDAPEAWELHTGDLGTVTVAVVDSGVTPHPEFEDRLLPGHNTDDPANPDWTIDECPHGTHVAGIVAARGNNTIGVAGVTWGANLLPVRVLGHPGPCSGFETAAAAGIIWAADNGADIINVSLQYCAGIQTFEDAVDYAQDSGVLVISAAGNSNLFCSPSVVAPARFAGSMAVSATTAADVLASFSNFGDELDVAAPGDMIYSTWVGDSYRYMGGTSMATPHVSGLAALLKSYAPQLTHTQVRGILTGTADDLGASGWDNLYGHGRINAYNAMDSLYEPPVPATPNWALVVLTVLFLATGARATMRRQQSLRGEN